MTPRAQIIDLIAENREALSPFLIKFFADSIRDLVAGGLDRADVLDAAFTAAVILKIEAFGVEDTITLLRGVADLHEGELGNGPFHDEVRH
jgi:hypothetical protein